MGADYHLWRQIPFTTLPRSNRCARDSACRWRACDSRRCTRSGRTHDPEHSLVTLPGGGSAGERLWTPVVPTLLVSPCLHHHTLLHSCLACVCAAAYHDELKTTTNFQAARPRDHPLRHGPRQEGRVHCARRHGGHHVARLAAARHRYCVSALLPRSRRADRAHRPYIHETIRARALRARRRPRVPVRPRHVRRARAGRGPEGLGAAPAGR